MLTWGGPSRTAMPLRLGLPHSNSKISGKGNRYLMENVVMPNIAPEECYVVEIDGEIQARYGVYLEALKAGLKLKRKFPNNDIKVHDISEQPSH